MNIHEVQIDKNVEVNMAVGSKTVLCAYFGSTTHFLESVEIIK